MNIMRKLILNIKDETKEKQLFVNEDKDEAMLTCSKSRKNISELPMQRYISYCSILYTK